MRQFLARWGSTFILASFVITSVTGVLLFYRVHTPPNEALHIWIGFLMIAAALIHIARNWRSFLSYFRKPQFYAALAVTAVISGFISYPALFGSGAQGDRGGPPGLRSLFAVSAALSEASLSRIAPLAHTDSESLVSKLTEAGMTVDNADATIKEIATASGKQTNDVLGTIFGGEGASAAPPRAGN